MRHSSLENDNNHPVRDDVDDDEGGVSLVEDSSLSPFFIHTALPIRNTVPIPSFEADSTAHLTYTLTINTIADCTETARMSGRNPPSHPSVVVDDQLSFDLTNMPTNYPPITVAGVNERPPEFGGTGWDPMRDPPYESQEAFEPSRNRGRLTRADRARNHMAWLHSTYIPQINTTYHDRLRSSKKYTYRRLPSQFVHPFAPPGAKTIIRLIQADTLAVARSLRAKYGDPRNDTEDRLEMERIAVHNFCHPQRRGGSFLGGGRGQEEDICMVSTLYLAQRTHLYPLGHDDVMFTRSIVVMKTLDDDNGSTTILDPQDQFAVSVFSSAAVHWPDTVRTQRYNADGALVQDETYARQIDRDLQKNKLRYILNGAINENITRLVLGAFGCGAFRNPPYEVAKMLYELLIDDGTGKPERDYAHYHVREVVIAIKDDTDDRVVWNAFMEVFQQGHRLHAPGGIRAPDTIQYSVFGPQDQDDGGMGGGGSNAGNDGHDGGDGGQGNTNAGGNGTGDRVGRTRSRGRRG